ncbi:MAG: tetratricopeptide repeat protein [Planctomycetota bacterium]|jgi:tetratricopeptide (TPR) repeat protein
MTLRTSFIIPVGIALLALGLRAKAELPEDQLYTLFNQANEAFRQANSTADEDKAEKLYEKAILTYERIVSEGRIQNARLFYNLGNAYLLKEDIGKAILNYKRAERIDAADANLRKNLEFARSQRIDRITPKAEKRVLQTLFFWHYDFSLRARFALTCIFFAVVCISAAAMVWFGRNPPATASAVIAAVLLILLATSVVIESKQRASSVSGVITAGSVVAYQGDGQSYPESFKDPLHAGTEFDLLEQRPGWFHIRLGDDSDGWIPQDAADLI